MLPANQKCRHVEPIRLLTQNVTTATLSGPAITPIVSKSLRHLFVVLQVHSHHPPRLHVQNVGMGDLYPRVELPHNMEVAIVDHVIPEIIVPIHDNDHAVNNNTKLRHSENVF